MKFNLTGSVNYDVGSCHDSRSVMISKEFHASNQKMAIKKARAIIKIVHKRYSHMTDYNLYAELRVVKPIWEISFIDGQDARPAITAEPACPAVPAHFEEKTFP